MKLKTKNIYFMKQKFSVIAMVTLLSSTLLLSSCIGSFNLTQKLYSWNKSAGDKLVNELVFIVLTPVYCVAIVTDALVLNSIEFWTDENPIAATETKQIETKDGFYTITTDANGHKIQKEGSEEIVEFIFNKEENSWSLNAMGIVTPLIQFEDNNQATVYLADGSTMTTSIDRAGVLALRQVVENKTYFAKK